jgi:hypothetical protein
MHGPPLLCRVVANLPRLHRSYSALRLPDVRRPRLWSSLAFGLPGGEHLALRSPEGSAVATTGARARRGSRFGTDDRLPRTGVHSETSGSPGLLGCPLLVCRSSKTPPDATSARPTYADIAAAATEYSPHGIRNLSLFEASLPPAHSLVCLRIDASLPPRRKAHYRPAGLGFSRTGLSPAGQLFRISGNHRMLTVPSDQHCLVALYLRSRMLDRLASLAT